MTSFHSHREQYGVEAICNVLPIAPSTYYEGKARETGHRWFPARALRDGELREQIRRVWKENVTAHPLASGFEVFVTVGERSGMWLSGMVCGWGSLMVTGG